MKRNKRPYLTSIIVTDIRFNSGNLPLLLFQSGSAYAKGILIADFHVTLLSLRIELDAIGTAEQRIIPDRAQTVLPSFWDRQCNRTVWSLLRHGHTLQLQ